MMLLPWPGALTGLVHSVQLRKGLLLHAVEHRKKNRVALTNFSLPLFFFSISVPTEDQSEEKGKESFPLLLQLSRSESA